MTVNVLQLIDRVIGVEGDYVDHPSDRGGPTRWGCTQDTARAYGYQGDMKVFPRPMAQEIFRKRFYEAVGLPLIADLAPALTAELLDVSINMGADTPGRFLQRLLNVMNRRQRDYRDMLVDGRIGPMTAAALTSFLKLRGAVGETVLIKGIEILKGSKYVALAENDESQEDFIFGWLANRIGLGAAA
ncbi:MAG: hypothetical protein KGJ57_18290 [Sphingomonadales bacterium]|nr:hypothetical protein [Sphingomonadales bacterium]MDE2171349.1 hypothetical protein [Sphingomonadales bacterium]